MAGSLLLLLDDIATVLDDDLALNAKQVTGRLPARRREKPFPCGTWIAVFA